MPQRQVIRLFLLPARIAPAQSWLAHCADTWQFGAAAACQQQAQAQERQKVARSEADTLDVERRAARARVDELQRQIRALEAQVNAPFNASQRNR